MTRLIFTVAARLLTFATAFAEPVELHFPWRGTLMTMVLEVAVNGQGAAGICRRLPRRRKGKDCGLGKRTPTMSKLGKKLIRAAKEARAIARGEVKASSYRIHLAGDIDVQSIRKRLGLSQAEFSARFGIPPGTLRDWEQGRRIPEGPARVLLKVIANDPKAVERALAAA